MDTDTDCPLCTGTHDDQPVDASEVCDPHFTQALAKAHDSGDFLPII